MRRSLGSILALGSVVLLLAGCAGSEEPTAGPAGDDTQAVSSPAAVTTAAATTAPGAGAADTADPEALDVCKMLDEAMVRQVLGEPATPTDQSAGQLYGCSWEGAGDALNVLSVTIYVHPDAATAAEQYELTMAGLEGSEILGLGQAASYNESFGLEVLHDRYDISVDNTGPDEKASDILVAKALIEQLSA